MKSRNINPRWFMVSVLFLFMCLSRVSNVCFAVENISTDQSLSVNQTIVSSAGVFELGFFRLGNSSNYYIGMWFNKVSHSTTVWVANRDKPVHDIYSSVLKISDAYAFENNRCSIWIDDLFDLQQYRQDDTTGITLYIKVAASDISSESIPTDKKREEDNYWSEQGKSSLVAFRYRYLEKVTKNPEKLGKGGFCSVFKGTLPDGSIIAVKKLESINQGEKQFHAQVGTIGKINHVNLVRLQGFCSEGSRKLLVYDFMQRGSLDRLLFRTKVSHQRQGLKDGLQTISAPVGNLFQLPYL
ncbi:putative 2-alkenal reductase [Hibiscus syriacus]|uniref:2-alkenal reductase n=1 Tax=Hibiscus syriacus TaxID=106335 RepID=A0A6A2XTD7_HIBSY|nr:putative 2-alkenal reductase [Hibiscus syriacus]